MEHPEAQFAVSVRRVLPTTFGQALRLITRIEDFPKYVPSIKRCRLIRRDRTHSVTEWIVELEGIPISWREEAVFDPRNRMLRFQLIEGDLEKFEGRWTLFGTDAGETEVLFEAVLKLGVPVFEHVVGGIVADKVRVLFESLLDALVERSYAEKYRMIGDWGACDVSGFGVIGHPYNYQHLVSTLHWLKPDFKAPSREFLTKVFDLTPSHSFSGVQEFRAPSGQATRGAFISCNIIPEMLSVDIAGVVRKVVDSCKVAERLGLGVVALGGFTSIAGERYGEEFLKHIHIPVTTGNTLTAALAVEGVLKAAKLRELDLAQAKVTVIGGAGDIGSACARVLASKVKEVTITSRSPHSLKKMEKVIKDVRRAKFRGSHDNNAAVKNADIVIAAASASQSVVDIAHFKPGAVVCDIGYPKNIAYAHTDRQDIFVFSGGICSLPGKFNTGFDIGLPSPDVLYGCFSEAIVLALEERYENFSWGKGHITQEKMDEILAMAAKHGFTLAPFFWGKRLVTDEEVKAVKT